MPRTTSNREESWRIRTRLAGAGADARSGGLDVAQNAGQTSVTVRARKPIAPR